jgi:nitrogen regulatory protein P-II 2
MALSHGYRNEVEDLMKLVKCIVRSQKVDETTEALSAIDLSGLTISQVAGRGRRPLPVATYRCVDYRVRYLPHMMIDVVVDDYMADQVTRIVMETARTGSRGDGQVFILPVDEAYTIRTRAGGLD